MTDDPATGVRRRAAPSPLKALCAVLRDGEASRVPPGGPDEVSPPISVIVANPGVGKTTVLVQLALDTMHQGQQVLHVALSDTVEHTRVHYDEIVRALGEVFRSPEALVRLERNRMIQSCHQKPFSVGSVERNLEVLADAAQFVPALLVVDGFGSEKALRAHLPELRALAAARKLAIWLAVTSDGDLQLDPGDRIARLSSSGRRLELTVGDASIGIDPVTGLALPEPGAAPAGDVAAVQVVARDCTLFSGGAAGAEAAFGEAAERHRVHEVNLTFDGHLQARTRGRYELTATELAMGDVSLSYVSRRLNRTYNDQGGLIRGVLQTLWHMVSRSQQVFVVGRIQEDGTVVGGTGWSVELARMWSRDLWVYDQEKQGWYHWDGASWILGLPRITATHICGTGTRYLEESGRRAIDDLFSRTFSGT